MAYKRNVELQYLNNFYNRTDNQIVVLYGQKYSGKMALLKEFIKGKDYYYYAARACSDNEQVKLMQDELKEELPKNSEIKSSYSGLISQIMEINPNKTVIVIDEFQNMIKSGTEFMEAVIHAAHNKWNYKPVMFVLCSSSTYWVENVMVEKLGELAFEISGLLKLNSLKFLDFVKYFKNYDLTGCVEAYSCLGGFPEIWESWDDTKTVAENICLNILTPGSLLYEYGQHILPAELREPTVYNTILATLAQDKSKLNDLYKATGFSRAKISVYLKNLIELDIVEKIDSINTAGRENVQKGIYRIKNPFVHFWFRYIFKNLSKLPFMSSDKFYTKYIATGFKGYSAKYFTEVCAEYLDLMNQSSKLSFRYTQRGVWVGKVGTIDTVAQNDEGKTLVALCNWEKPVMTFADYEWLMFCVKQAKLDVSDIYMFSMGDFDLELKQEAMINKGLKLIDSTQL